MRHLSAVVLILACQSLAAFAVPTAAPDEGETAQQLCANYRLQPQYYPYLDTSFIGEQHFIQVGTVNYSYHQFGPLNVSAANAGKSVLLINGAGHTQADWSPCFLKPLAAGRQVTIFDNRGLGMSTDTFTGNYTLDDFASSIVELSKALRLDTPHILGLSTGSTYAQAIAVNYGTDVANVVLSGTILTGSGIYAVPEPVSPTAVFQPAQGISQDVPSRSYPYYTPAGLAGLCTNLNLTSYMPPDVASTAQVNHQATVGYDVAGLGGQEVYHGLSNVTNPVLVISGVQDVVLPDEYDVKIAVIIPAASLIQWPEAGHYSLFQYCLQNAAIINAWFSDND